jgi:hypothetical protein
MGAFLEKVKGWAGIGQPGGWDDVVIRTVKTGITAAIVFALKEGLADPEPIINAAWAAGGTFFLNGFLVELNKWRDR